MHEKEIERGLKIRSGKPDLCIEREEMEGGAKIGFPRVGGNLTCVWKGDGRGSKNWVGGNLTCTWRGNIRGNENMVRGTRSVCGEKIERGTRIELGGT
jgi:hypothetical protein